MPAAYILDTNVLTSFHAAGWFETLGSWPPATPVVVSAAVWAEFQAYASRDQPDWLTVDDAELDALLTAEEYREQIA